MGHRVVKKTDDRVICDNGVIPTLLAGSHALRTPNRHMLAIVTQVRTGQVHVGEYYQTTSSPINTGYLSKLSDLEVCYASPQR